MPRTYNESGARVIAGGVPYRPSDHFVLLVTSRKHPEQWIVPKGGVEPNETPSAAAVRETEEEAGVVGEAVAAYESFEFSRKPGTRLHVHPFLIKVSSVKPDSEWLERNERRRDWFHVDRALELMAERPEMKKILEYTRPFLRIPMDD